MMFPAKVIVLAGVCFFLSFGLGSPKHIIQMTRVEVVNRDNVANATASIRRFGSSENYVADFQVAVLQDIPDMQVNTLYYIPTLSGKLDRPFYNHTTNFCTYLKLPYTDRILHMIYEDLNRRGNLPKKCPVKVGTYSFNTTFDSFRLPSFLPESIFRFDLNFYRGQQRELCFESHWFGRLRKVLC